MHDGCHGFECHAENNGFAIADAALDTPGAIGQCPHFAALHAEKVIVLASGVADAVKARTDFKTLACGQAHHGFGQVGFEPVKDGFPEARGNAPHDAFDDAPGRIAARIFSMSVIILAAVF